MSDINYHGPVVVFDLDDTLFRERDFCRSGFRFLCDPLRYHIPGIEVYPSASSLNTLVSRMDAKLTSGANPFTPFEEFFTPLVDGDFNIKDHIDAYRSHIPDHLTLAYGVKETLDMLADRGIRMGLITDGRSGTQRCKVEALGLHEFIAPELILISEETGYDKFSRNMFAMIVRQFPEARCFFYVGDNPRKDFYHPNLMGWISVQVPPHPDNVHLACEPESPLHAPLIVLDNFSDLTEIVGY